MRALAEVSKYGHFHFAASVRAISSVTFRSDSRSDLLPTKTLRDMKLRQREKTHKEDTHRERKQRERNDEKRRARSRQKTETAEERTVRDAIGKHNREAQSRQDAVYADS